MKICNSFARWILDISTIIPDPQFSWNPTLDWMNSFKHLVKLYAGSSSSTAMDQSVADNIGRLIQARYEQLMVGQLQHSRRKVIAGMVMTRDREMQEMEVITVSTGTKCVNGEYLSNIGKSLNDCHAEIISRRCLMDFLYNQLEKVFSANGKALNKSKKI